MRRLSALTILCLISAWTGAASATVLEKLELEVLGLTSAAVVRGTVEGQRFETGNDGRLYTFTTVRVIERYRGSTPDRLTVRQMGGEKDGMRFEVVGTPRLEPSSEVVLFLITSTNPDDSGYYFIRGMTQGAFRLITGPAGTPVAVRDLSGSGLIARSGGAAPVESGDLQRIPLADLVAAIRALPAPGR